MVFAGALLFLAFSFFRTSNLPWVEEDNYYGAIYAQAAHNNLRAGITETGGVPVTLYFGPLPLPREEYYVHHPTLMPLMVTASVALLGESERAVRLVPISCSLLSLLFLWLLLRDTAGRRAAALTAVFFATMPMELHYGDMVDFEPCEVMWMLASLLCLRRWHLSGLVRWALLAGLCCMGAVCTDWPGYLFVLGVSISFLMKNRKRQRLFALSLLGGASLSGMSFLLQIRKVNPDAWTDLTTAIMMRLGNGVSTGSSASAQSHALHFTFQEWCGSVLHGLGQDYLLISWVPVVAGLVFLLRRMKSDPGYRWLAKALLLMAMAGVPYMLLLRNWSYIHDFASFFALGAIAIAGGLGLECLAFGLEGKLFGRRAQPLVAFVLLGLLVWLGQAGFSRAEKQRSQFCMLDGSNSEPYTLIPDTGRYLARTFSGHTTILCNFDPYGSTLPYYAQRSIVNNLVSADDWKSANDCTARPVGGIIWLSAPRASDILATIPETEITRHKIDGLPFAIWKPAE